MNTTRPVNKEFPHNPGAPMWVEYLHTVTTPDFKAGEAGEIVAREAHWAAQLIAEGYCRAATPPEAPPPVSADAAQSSDPGPGAAAETSAPPVPRGVFTYEGRSSPAAETGDL